MSNATDCCCSGRGFTIRASRWIRSAATRHKHKGLQVESRRTLRTVLLLLPKSPHAWLREAVALTPRAPAGLPAPQYQNAQSFRSCSVLFFSLCGLRYCHIKSKRIHVTPQKVECIRQPNSTLVSSSSAQKGRGALFLFPHAVVFGWFLLVNVSNRGRLIVNLW